MAVRLLLLLLLPLTGCPTPRADGAVRAAPPVSGEAGALGIETIPDPLFTAPLLTLQGVLSQYQYHLNLRNRTPRPLRIHRVVLTELRGGEVLRRSTLERSALERGLRPTAWIVLRDRQSIAAAHRARRQLERAKGDTVVPARGAVALSAQFAVRRPDQVPDTIRCEVEHELGRSAHAFGVRVFKQQTRLRLPFEGRWWLMAGHHFYEQHAQVTLESQSFAYDLGVLGDNLATFDGDSRRNASYHANGRPILAAAAGTVVAVHDGVAENEPVGRRPVWSSLLQRPDDLAGNYVVLRHREGEHSAYLHLRPGVLVKPGARVAAGQRLGLCGNSGNSLETHLHFQLQNGPDLFRSSGLPARFSDFTFHLGHIKVYVPPERPLPLPGRWLVEPGRSPGAVEISRVLPVK